MKKLALLFFFAAVIGFGFGLAHLFRLRFETGDIYPAYSSLRADPIGTKALYAGLDPLVPTERRFQPLSKLGDGGARTLLFLGLNPDDFRLLPEDWKHLEAFAGSGGRLVISLLPSFYPPRTNWFALKAAQKRAASKGGVGTNAPPVDGSRQPWTGPDGEEFDARAIPLQKRWDLGLGFATLPRNDAGVFKSAMAFNRTADTLPETLPCHTALYFDQAGEPWRTIYAREPARPVLIERPLGRGTIVLVADSFHFSNEALRHDRQAALLAWLVGSSRHVIFEESHLGVQEAPGVATLVRRYRLHGLLAGVLLLAGLFVWKNAASFIPPDEEQRARDRGDLIAGKESAAGFVNLLRRNIPGRDLLGICLQEWRKSCAHQVSRARLEQVQAIIDAENALDVNQRRPIETYRAISQILSERSPLLVSSSEARPRP
jgi:hypothetical protein